MVLNPSSGRVHLEKGKKLDLKVEYAQMGAGKIRAQLIWSSVDLNPSPAAIEAAKNADVVVAVVGITSQLEGEEMPVTEEGFKGGDRTSLDLPKPEQALLEAVANCRQADDRGLDERERPRRELGEGSC